MALDDHSFDQSVDRFESRDAGLAVDTEEGVLDGDGHAKLDALLAAGAV